MTSSQLDVYQEFLVSPQDDIHEQLTNVLDDIYSYFSEKPDAKLTFLPIHPEVEIISQNLTPAEIITSKIENDKIEEPFFIVDLAHVERQLNKWNSLLPRVTPYYAVKCNPDPMIVELLASLGVNFDCASVGEIEQVLSYGVDSSRIIYANPCKPPKQIRIAHEHGVDLTTFDNADELLKIKQQNPDAKVVLRIVTDDSNSRCRFSSKFGAQAKHVPTLLKLAQSLGLQVVGVSFHVGSGCMSAKSFSDAVASAKKVFDIAATFGIKMTLLDIGGGFPGVDRENGVNFPEIAKEISHSLDEHFPESSGVEIIAEPGRYFVSGAHTLAVSVYARRNNLTFKKASSDGQKVDEPEFLYYVTDGVYGSFNCILYDHAVCNPVFLKDPQEKTLHASTIFGPTCDSMDCISKNILIPKLEVGDWLYFNEMGAYTCAASSEFNGFKRPFLYYLYSGNGKS